MVTVGNRAILIANVPLHLAMVLATMLLVMDNQDQIVVAMITIITMIMIRILIKPQD